MVAIRRGVRYAARLVPAMPASHWVQRLVTDSPGTLDALRWEPAERPEPGAGEIEIEVCAHGLNFRDVLNALGVFGVEQPQFGAECAGIVTRVGAEVRSFRPGDRVLAFAPYSLQSYATVPEAYAASLPGGMSFVQAATIPVAFLTAHYGFGRLARLAQGQSVLIHAAAGGLGLAALQLAQRAGAEIYATAGSERKREFLRGLGVRQVFDSRSQSFREGVLQATGGRGVDVVLNSLTGEMIPAGLDCLAPNGCFLEVGKRGIWSEEAVYGFRPDARYFAFDLGDVAREDPELIRAMLGELTAEFAAGGLQPLRTSIYASEDAVAAFRTMAQAGHIGKIVLSRQPEGVGQELNSIVARGTVLVVGGLGALGSALAQQLARKGAKRLVLAGRAAHVDAKLIEELQADGAEVVIEPMDVTNPEAVEAVLERIRSSGAPLKAVFHAAGVVQDGLLESETWESYREAGAAKIEGAWNLHRLTAGDPVELMVFFSSAAGILGSPGQGSYAAANAFLDALAHERAARGLATLSVDWGGWAAVGMAARLSPEHAARLERQGMGLLDASAALAAMEKAIAERRTQVAVVDIDWERFLEARAAADGGFFSELRRRQPLDQERPAEAAIREVLMRAPSAERKGLLAAHVRECARHALSLRPGATVRDDVPLQEVGLDSLMAIDMKNELAQSLQLSLSAGLLFNYPTVGQLTEYLLLQLPAADAVAPRERHPDAALVEMSEEEAERRLLEELERTGSGRRMPEMTTGVQLSPVKRALAEIQRLRARVGELEKSSAEPVAIVGTGLRLPGGVTDEATFWELLAEGRDTIRQVPPERWDWRAWDEPERTGAVSGVSRYGGFLDNVDAFDAGFFGIAPREAVMMDPQHRLALEIAWEALENAGYASAAVQGSATGIFLGIGNSDYGRHIFRNPEAMDAYAGSGNSPAMVAGRLAYVLGLHGPALAIDTSCSSSLVAVHEACASLRLGECTMALAGGVNLMLLPEAHVALSRAQMMAPDGHCKTFDEAADGYVRGEGGGIVVLKKLADAMRDGDRILAVIRGSAVNHDGRSGGLTAPSGPAQMAVIRKALEMARVEPAEIGFVETHGTGTALGDPIEVEALSAVLCEGRDPRQPLLLGAVKTNLGHLEAASGIAGLIKAVLVLRHGRVPANLHLKKKNTRIPWDRLSVAVPTENTAWGGKYAGVSSFGFSGTNAHVILERAPEAPVEEKGAERPWHVLAISAKSEAGLANLRRRYAALLRKGESQVADVCFTSNTGRSHFEHRCAVVGQTAEEMAAALEGSGESRCFTGTADGEPGRIGFLFTGQGSQYAGMGGELYKSSAVYREAVERCSAVWQELVGASLTLYGGSELKEAREAQPALFALEYGLAELWRSWGVEPALVLGHSLGEYVGAVIAGLLTLEDGLRLVHARAELMDRLAVRGGMRAVAADAERVRGALAGWEAEVSIAAINGPSSVVISGSVDGLKAVAGKLESQGVRTRELEVSHAFHSPLLEPMLEEFEERAEKVTYGKPRVRMVSNLTGRLAAVGEMGRARYWREHMRQTVQFHAGLQSAVAAGCTTFIEIGPQPHLRAIAAKTDAGMENRIKVSMTRNGSAYAQMCESLAQVYVEGQPVNWAGFEGGWRRSRVALPTYPFERQRYWQGPKAGEIAQQVWQQAGAAGAAQAQFAPMDMKVEAFPKKWEALKTLTVAQMLATLGELGVLAEAGPHDPEALLVRAGVVAAQHRLMGRWFSLLASEGYLSWSGTRIVIPAEINGPDLERAWNEVEASCRMIRTCCNGYATAPR